MGTIPSFEANYVRSRLFCNGVITVALAAILAIGSVKAQSSGGRGLQIKLVTDTSFGPAKQIDASLLNVGPLQTGTADSLGAKPPHGWVCWLRGDRPEPAWLRYDVLPFE